MDSVIKAPFTSLLINFAIFMTYNLNNWFLTWWGKSPSVSYNPVQNKVHLIFEKCKYYEQHSSNNILNFGYSEMHAKCKNNISCPVFTGQTAGPILTKLHRSDHYQTYWSMPPTRSSSLHKMAARAKSRKTLSCFYSRTAGQISQEWSVPTLVVHAFCTFRFIAQNGRQG